MNTTVKYEYKNLCTSLFKRKEIPKIGKNGTKLTFKSFNSKLAPRNFLKLGIRICVLLFLNARKYQKSVKMVQN